MILKANKLHSIILKIAARTIKTLITEDLANPSGAATPKEIHQKIQQVLNHHLHNLIAKHTQALASKIRWKKVPAMETIKARKVIIVYKKKLRMKRKIIIEIFKYVIIYIYIFVLNYYIY